MASRYKLPFEDMPTGAVADTFTTLATLIAADTAGYRFRIRSLQVGPADDTPTDANGSVRLHRVADVSAGGVGSSADTVAGSVMPKVDPSSRDAVISGARAHSSEPTTYETEPLWQMDFNVRGGFIKEWSAEDAPICGRDMLIGLTAAPRAGVAIRLSGTIEFEEY